MMQKDVHYTEMFSSLSGVRLVFTALRYSLHMFKEILLHCKYPLM